MPTKKSNRKTNRKINQLRKRERVKLFGGQLTYRDVQKRDELYELAVIATMGQYDMPEQLARSFLNRDPVTKKAMMERAKAAKDALL